MALIGGAVLLLSFITQNFFHDKWNSRMRELEIAMSDRSVIDKSVLLNEVLYFVAFAPENQTTGRVREAYIAEAARKLAISSEIPVMLSDAVTSEQKVQLVNALDSRARNVHDYESFVANVKYINTTYDSYFDEIVGNYRHLNKLSGYARWVYLSLYVLGSAIALVGVWQEIS